MNVFEREQRDYRILYQRACEQNKKMLEALKRVEEITVNTVDADYVELDNGLNDINTIVCDTIEAVEEEE